MRKQLKYKSFSRTYLINKLPTRILNFKRTKWLRVKKYLRRSLRNKISFLSYAKKYLAIKRKIRRVKKLPVHKRYFIKYPPRYGYYKKIKLKPTVITSNPFKIYILKRKKLYLKYDSKEKVKFKRTLTNLYGKKVNLKFKNKNRLNVLSSVWYKIYYMPYQLLWYRNLVTSTEEARKNVEAKRIFLNDKVLRSNLLLKRGDILSLKNNSYNFKKIKEKYLSRYINVKTVIVDYYSQELVITEDFKDIDENILHNSLPKGLDTKYLDI